MNEAYHRSIRKLVAKSEPGDVIVSKYAPASWWHPEGRHKAIRRLEARGFPWLKGWLFFTVTLDRERFAGPEEGYEAGKDRLRRVMFELRKEYRIKRYFSKMELHGDQDLIAELGYDPDGWPHWHIGVDCRSFIPESRVRELWGLGITDVRRVKANKWKYLFKYVVKGNGALPDWVLDYPKRIRVFQTSVGFFGEGSAEDTGDAPEPADEPDEVEAQPGETLREKFHVWDRKVLLRARSSMHRVCPALLRCTFRQFLVERVFVHGRPAIDAFNLAVGIEEIPCILSAKPSSGVVLAA